MRSTFFTATFFAAAFFGDSGLFSAEVAFLATTALGVADFVAFAIFRVYKYKLIIYLTQTITIRYRVLLRYTKVL
ncbi:hypothetical protein D9M68_800980 [compost metagenome]